MTDNSTEQLDNEKEEVRPEEVPAEEELTDAAADEILSEEPPTELNTVEQPKKKKYGWVGYVLLLAVIALGVFLMFKVVYAMGDDVKSFDQVILASDWRFAVITVAVLLAIFGCMWFQYVVILKTTTGKCHFRAGLKVAFVGKFYDNVTPFATGGQPMQIYYLNKKGLNGGTSSAVIMIKYFAWMFCWLLLSLILMASFTGVLETQTQSIKLLLLIGGWIGLVVNMCIPVLVILFVVLPKFSRSLVKAVVGIGTKLKIIKHPRRALYKVAKIVHDFRTSFKIMSRHPLNFILLILLCFVEIFLTFAFPYFVMKMFSGLTDADGIGVMFTVMALNIYATMSSSVVPTPGNSGVIEGVFTAAFTALAGSVLLWTVFVWRFGVYYVYIVIGIFMTVYDFIKKIVINKKKKPEKL